MIINKGKVLSREAIEDHIYDVDYEGGSNVVNVYIRFLRRKIDEPFEKKLIHTFTDMASQNFGLVLGA